MITNYEIRCDIDGTKKRKEKGIKKSEKEKRTIACHNDLFIFATLLANYNRSLKSTRIILKN